MFLFTGQFYIFFISLRNEIEADRQIFIKPVIWWIRNLGGEAIRAPITGQPYFRSFREIKYSDFSSDFREKHYRSETMRKIQNFCEHLNPSDLAEVQNLINCNYKFSIKKYKVSFIFDIIFFGKKMYNFWMSLYPND